MDFEFPILWRAPERSCGRSEPPTVHERKTMGRRLAIERGSFCLSTRATSTSKDSPQNPTGAKWSQLHGSGAFRCMKISEAVVCSTYDLSEWMNRPRHRV